MTFTNFPYRRIGQNVRPVNIIRNESMFFFFTFLPKIVSEIEPTSPAWNLMKNLRQKKLKKKKRVDPFSNDVSRSPYRIQTDRHQTENENQSGF